MSDAILARLAEAVAVAAEAAALALAYFHSRADLVIEAKASPQDIVSQADRAVEELIRQRLGALFSDDGFLGEEDAPKTGTSGFLWIIDPIDGTVPFVAGLPHWCVAIALMQDDVTVAAVTHAPLSQEVFTARLGHGARLNGSLLRLDDQATVQTSLIGLGANHRTLPEHMADVIRDLLQDGGVFYRNGSGALMLASVAAGRLGGYYEPHMNAWDCIGGLLMVREAGGQTRAFCRDKPLSEGDAVLAAAPGVWADLSRITAFS